MSLDAFYYLLSSGIKWYAVQSFGTCRLWDTASEVEKPEKSRIKTFFFFLKQGTVCVKRWILLRLGVRVKTDAVIQNQQGIHVIYIYILVVFINRILDMGGRVAR
jgi:hypothetical protein